MEVDVSSRDPKLEQYRREVGWYLLPNNDEQESVGHGDQADSKPEGAGPIPARSATDSKGKS